MEQIVETFGINWKLLVIQAVNFAVLLFLLHRFLYKPLLKLLDERRGKLEKGMEDAKQAGIALTEANSKKEEILSQTKREAKEIIEKAVAGGEKMKEGIVSEASEEARGIISHAEKSAKEEKERIVAAAKKDLGGAVVLAVEKILREKVNPEMERELIAKSYG